MSLKKVAEVKKDKGFKIWDLIIYGGILVIVAVLFIAIFATKDNSPFTGIRVLVKREVVFEYVFDGDYKINNSEKYSVTVEEKDNGLTYVTVNTEGNGVNVILIDNKMRTVKMYEANCRSKDCLNFAPIKDNGGSIQCMSHYLEIQPYNYNPDSPIQPI